MLQKLNSKIFALILLLSITVSCKSKVESESTFEERIFTPIEDLRIEDTDEHFIGKIGHIAIGMNNEIYIADDAKLTIHMYDAEGHFLKEFGREGRGPGEFLYIGGIKTFPDGRLATWDQRNQRISVFSFNGEFITSHNVNSGLNGMELFKVNPNGEFFVKRMLRAKRNGRNNADISMAWLHVSKDGQVTDTLHILKDPNENRGFVYFSPSGPSFSFIELTISALSPFGYFIVGRNTDYKLELRKSSGTVTISHDYIPVKLKPEEETRWKRSLNRVAAQGNDVDTSIPDTKPVYKQILTDSEGRIWIHRYTEADYSESPIYTEEGGWWEAAAFDIFLDDGSFHGSVKFPHGFNFTDAKGNFAYGVLTTDDLAEHVVRYKLTPNR